MDRYVDREGEIDSSLPSGKVYLLKAGNHYKIGITQGSVEKRVNALQTGSAYPIEIVHVVRTKEPRALEAYLHAKYAKKRRYGE